ncbi:MAG TPA: DUF3488 and transglutaminase-like domain-containing protein [Candidatus Angelobacter sp.]|jgi:transglutaminase-like putative cysteine protease|nr:DUF3488 and transglutaminase-like domain-containing protein [Candidatus Angelobacter sp.]
MNQSSQRTGGAERFFQWSLYLLLVTGFVALLGTNKLDPPSLLLVVPALLVRGLLLLMRKEFSISERLTSYLTLAYFIFYLLDYIYISQSFIGATVHMVLFTMVVKIFSVRRDRDLVYLAILAFLMLLAAAVLTVDTLFLVTFGLFILVAIATFISMEMRRSEKEGLVVEVPERFESRFQGSLAGMAGILGVLTLAGSAILFFIIPRVNTGGFLRNLGTEAAIVSGFSQEVRLGGIGQIQQSNAPVMHVKVLWGKLPADVKWRGLSLANFDGQRWWNPTEERRFHGMAAGFLDISQAFAAPQGPAQAVPRRRISTLSYKVVMEPLGLDLFFLAPVPMKIAGDYRVVELTADGAVYNAHPVMGKTGMTDVENPQPIGTYTAEADTRDPEALVRDSVSQDYPAHIESVYLQRPRLDPRIAGLAEEVTAKSRSNFAKAKAIESYLRQNFGYTLQLPGNRPRDPLAYFLFERKKGHCEYFASSMTIMLRVIGIPARVVNGFRGGEYNDLTGSYIVRQKDAHSWVEAYFPEAGWVTFDPTPAAGGGVPDTRWARLALYMDAANEMWREWIVNYDFTHQVRLSTQISTSAGNAQSNTREWFSDKYKKAVQRVLRFEERLQRLTPTEMATICVILGVLLALPFLPRSWRKIKQARAARDPQNAPRSAASFWYLRFLKRLSREGFKKAPGQTPVEFAASIDDPETRHEAVVFTEHYERARFDESVEDAERLPQLYEEMAGRRK